MKTILINKEIWQTRVAILHNKKLQDLYFDHHAKDELDKCFFKGKVSKVLPGIQTAFVNIGQTKAGFLHISEVDRALAAEKMFEEQTFDDASEQETFERTVKQSMDIGKIFSEGDEVLVQVIKEPIYEKGAKLTTCFTLPGKFIVLMPNIPQIGISKKIENKNERTRLREILAKNLPKGMGAIIRTTAEERAESDLIKDLSFLVATWKAIVKKNKKAQVGEKIYEDLPITLRAVRDHLDDDVEMVLTNDDETQQAVYKFVKNFTPEQAFKVRLHKEPPLLFDEFNVTKQIEDTLQKKVFLKSGGSLIIETTEAMTVVDVNTGKYTGKANMEETILKTNLEAAEELVRQLRLRNIGGLIVIDFIDMASGANRQKLSRVLEKTLKEKDKFQSVTLKISEFGLVQMTRKRSGKTLMQQIMHECQCCHAYGYVKSDETLSFEVLQQFQSEVMNQKMIGSIALLVSPTVFNYLVHDEFQSLLTIEKKLNCKIILESNTEFTGSQCKVNKVKEKA